jgi:hypothetical protein
VDWIRADRQIAGTIKYFEENMLGVQRDLLQQERLVRQRGGAAGIHTDDELPQLERTVADLEAIVKSLRDARQKLRTTPGYREQDSFTDFFRGE